MENASFIDRYAREVEMVAATREGAAINLRRAVAARLGLAPARLSGYSGQRLIDLANNALGTAEDMPPSLAVFPPGGPSGWTVRDAVPDLGVWRRQWDNDQAERIYGFSFIMRYSGEWRPIVAMDSGYSLLGGLANYYQSGNHAAALERWADYLLGAA